MKPSALRVASGVHQHLVAVAAVDRRRELDHRAVGVPRGPLDPERRASRLGLEQLGLLVGQVGDRDALDRLRDPHAVPVLEEVVEAAVVEVLADESREAPGGHVRLLRGHRLGVGGADATDADHPRAGRDLEPGGEAGTGPDLLDAEQPRAGLVATGAHVLGERREVLGLGDPRLGDERAAAAVAVQQPALREPVELEPHGHPGHAEVLGEVALARDGASGRQLGDPRLEDLLQHGTLGTGGWHLDHGRQVAGLPRTAAHETSLTTHPPRRRRPT